MPPRCRVLWRRRRRRLLWSRPCSSAGGPPVAAGSAGWQTCLAGCRRRRRSGRRSRPPAARRRFCCTAERGWECNAQSSVAAIETQYTVVKKQVSVFLAVHPLRMRLLSSPSALAPPPPPPARPAFLPPPAASAAVTARAPSRALPTDPTSSAGSSSCPSSRGRAAPAAECPAVAAVAGMRSSRMLAAGIRQNVNGTCVRWLSKVFDVLSSTRKIADGFAHRQQRAKGVREEKEARKPGEVARLPRWPGL